MKLRIVLLLVVTTGLIAPLRSYAQSNPISHSAPAANTPAPKKATAQMYECPICHHKVNATQAKALHYTCPVDNGRLAPVKTITQHKSSKPLSH